MDIGRDDRSRRAGPPAPTSIPAVTAEQQQTATAGPSGGEPAPDLGPRAVTYPYKRIERPRPTPPEGPDPYGNDDPAWLEIDWSEHLRWLDVDGTLINYAEIGEGKPVLFVHGLGGCWQNWLENMPHFAAAGYRAIALDLPGFGHSPMPDWEIGMPAYGRLVDEFCRLLHLQGVTLVGNSMGGFIAAETAIDMPEWISHLVLVSAAGISHAAMRKEPVTAWARVMTAASPLALRFNHLGLQRPAIRQLAFGGVIRHPERIRTELLYEFTAEAIGTEGFADAVISLTGYDFLDRLERIAVPTLLIWGRDDLMVPAADAPSYESRIADSELHIFDECGHLAMAERPVRFNRLTQSFIER